MSDSSKLIDIDFNGNNISKNNSLEEIEIKYFEGSYDNFFHNFLIPNKPCIIRNVTEKWKCKDMWVHENGPNIDYLRDRYGDTVVTVADCSRKYYNAQLKTCVEFKRFADYWENLIKKNYPSSEPCLYLKDWHLVKDFPEEILYTVPPEFSCDWLNEFFASQKDLNDDYKFVYMGPKGSWTPFHVDVFTSYSWSVNICGEKKWVLLSPGEENKLKDKFGNLPYDLNYSENLRCDDNEPNINYKFVVQKAGEAIFIPSGWYHQVWNESDTISINHNWINACNIDKMWLSMKINLEDVKKEISEFRSSMDDWDDHCQLLLKSCFGMNFNEFHNLLRYILDSRKYCIENKIELIVDSGWKLSINQLQYDIMKVREILKIFLNYPSVKSCKHYLL